MTTKKATEKTAHKAPKPEKHDAPKDPTPDLEPLPTADPPTPDDLEPAIDGLPEPTNAPVAPMAIPTGPDGYEEIRRVYQVPAALGMRVKVHDREGVLVAPRMADVVDIWFDGDDHAHVCHPTEGDVVYLDAKGGI